MAGERTSPALLPQPLLHLGGEDFIQDTCVPAPFFMLLDHDTFHTYSCLPASLPACPPACPPVDRPSPMTINLHAPLTVVLGCQCVKLECFVFESGHMSAGPVALSYQNHT